MKIQQELEQLLNKEVIPEINDYIDDLFEVIASKKDTPEIKEELQEIQEMKTDFLAILGEIKDGEITDEECAEIIDEIKEMKSDNFDDEDEE